MMPLIFNNLGYLRQTLDVDVPFERTNLGLAGLIVFIPKFFDIILVNFYNLSYLDFRNSFSSILFI